MEANATLLRLFMRMPKSPLLVATSDYTQFDPLSTEIKMVDMKPDVLVPEIVDGIYVEFQQNPHIFLGRIAWWDNVKVRSDVRVSEK